MQHDSDIALIAQPVFHEGVDTLVSARLPLMGLVQEDAVATDNLAPDALLDFDLIAPPEPSGLRAHLDVELKRMRLSLRPGFETRSPVPPRAGQGPGRPSLQVCLAPMVDHAWLQAHRARLVPLRRFAPAQLVLCKREGRNLPLAVEKFVQALTSALEPYQSDPAEPPRS